MLTTTSERRASPSQIWRTLSRSTLVGVGVLAALAGCAAPDPATAPNPEPGRYAAINGMQMYYETHGPDTGRPLVLLHGSLSGIGPDFATLIPALAGSRRVIAIEQQAHGHTGDIDRPLRVEHMVEDTAALLRSIGVTEADVLGYSTGAQVGLDLAIRQPDLVHKLVLVSPTFTTAGLHPGLLDGLQQIDADALQGSPFHEYYTATAPRPQDFATLVTKNKDLQRHSPERPAELIRSMTTPALLVLGDSDLVQPEHAVQMFRLLGGGVFGDLAGLPSSQLAVLPGTSHLSVIHRPELPTIVPAFLDAPISPRTSG